MSLPLSTSVRFHCYGRISNVLAWGRLEILSHHTVPVTTATALFAVGILFAQNLWSNEMQNFNNGRRQNVVVR